MRVSNQMSKALLTEKVCRKSFRKRRQKYDDHLHYSNHVGKFQLMLSGDIETNPGFIRKLSRKKREKTV